MDMPRPQEEAQWFNDRDCFPGLPKLIPELQQNTAFRSFSWILSLKASPD